MTGSRLFWMVVQALIIGALTFGYYLDHPKEPPFAAFLIFTVVVATATSFITHGYDAIRRRLKGIPPPPKIEVGKPLYQPAPSKKMTAGRAVSLLAHVAAIAGLGYAMHLYSPKELLLTITVPLAFVIVLAVASIFQRIKECAAGPKPSGAYVETDGRSVEILPPDRAT